jgi:hypothetical protein
MNNDKGNIVDICAVYYWTQMFLKSHNYTTIEKIKPFIFMFVANTIMKIEGDIYY